MQHREEAMPSVPRLSGWSLQKRLPPCAPRGDRMMPPAERKEIHSCERRQEHQPLSLTGKEMVNMVPAPSSLSQERVPPSALIT